MNHSDLRQLTMNGVLASHAVKELQLEGLLRSPLGGTEERRDTDLFAGATENIRNSSLQMQRYFRLLFVFENVIREFVGERLREADKTDDWFDGRATSAMKSKVADRKDKELRNRWHVGRNDDPVYYLDFGDLELLIIKHWELFKDFFPNQAWVTSRMQEAERTRNVIAHTNVLAREEGERLEMYLRDWLNQIG